MTEDEQLRQIKRISDATRQGIQLLFQQGFAAGVGSNINKGEKEAIRLGTLAGLACLRGINDANQEAVGQMEQNFESIMESFFEPDKPKVEVVPASVIQRNGKLVHH